MLLRKWRSFTEKAEMVVVKGKLVVVVVNRKSGCHLRKKWMSFTEKVEVVYRGSGNGGLYRKNCGFDRQLRNRMSYTETVEVVYRESGNGGR